MTQGQKKTYLILGIVSIVTVVATGITVGIVISRRKRTKEFEELLDIIAKGNAGQTGGKGSAWDTSLYTNNPSKKTINWSELQEMAEKIYKAQSPSTSHPIADDEESVFAIFKRLQNKYDVSALSFAFYKKYGKDLYEYLAKFMDNTGHWVGDSHNWMTKVRDTVKQLN